MRVLLFSNHYPASDAPTRGTYNHHIFNALGKWCDIRVVGPIAWWTRTRRIRELFIAPRESRFGLDAAFPTFFSIPGAAALHGHATSISLAAHLARLHREFPWDVVVGSNAYPDGVGAADVAAVSRAPLVQNVIGTDVNELPERPALGRQIRAALRRAQRVVAVSRHMADRVVALGIPRDRVVAQHNGVDGTTFAPRDRAEARKRVGLDHRGPVIVYVGNVKIGKGVGVLVDSMAPLIRRHGREGALLCIVGSGEAEAEIAARVRDLGLQSNIRLAGRQLHTEVPFWISAADILCLPSFMEGCPNVVLEALASGRGVVATRVGGIPELLRDGETGILVPPGNPVALAAGLAKALARPWDPAIQRASVEHLSWEGVARAYHDIIEAAVAERRGEGMSAEGRPRAST
jgi:glycosyltransferase involved in cell wall biosynthesis